jgi:hypothetical protein
MTTRLEYLNSYVCQYGYEVTKHNSTYCFNKIHKTIGTTQVSGQRGKETNAKRLLVFIKEFLLETVPSKNLGACCPATFKSTP